MKMRAVSNEEVIELIQTGSVKQKEMSHKFWVYKHFENRKNNFITVSLAVEGENLVVITVLGNWSVQS